MLKTRIPRGRSVRRFGFLPLTGDEIEKLESVPTAAADHLGQCSCGRNGGSGRVLAELADPRKLALAHGHQLTIRPHVTDYALDIDIGTSVLGGEEALGGRRSGRSSRRPTLPRSMVEHARSAAAARCCRSGPP